MSGFLQGLQDEMNNIDCDDTAVVDNLISQELLQLSLEERNALEEEIHGVHCRAIEETPELLQLSLQKLAAVLDRDDIIPFHQKRAYIQSQYLPTTTYIHSDDFRLRFLRFTFFDVVAAAKKMVKFLDLACHFFGNVVLERPPRLNDFNKKELQYLRNGHIQFLPYRDRSGRRIYALINPSPYEAGAYSEFNNETDTNKRRTSKIFMVAKLYMYMNWIAGDDIDTQRKGLVCVIWFGTTFNVMRDNVIKSAPTNFRPEDMTSCRMASIHICLPDTPLHRFFAAVLRVWVGRGRLKTRIHYGNSVELLYRIQSFGIPTEHMPISFSGTIKTGYMKQWARAREAKESQMYLDLANEARNIIECPKLNDVLFRQGISLSWNPGNASVRSLIQEMQEEQHEADNKRQKLKRRTMVLDIIEEVSKTGRFLTWNEGGWWNEVADKEQLIMKIEYLIKEVRKSKRDRIVQGNQKLGGGTSIFSFQNDSNKRARTKDYLSDKLSIDDDRTCSFGCFTCDKEEGTSVTMFQNYVNHQSNGNHQDWTNTKTHF